MTTTNETNITIPATFLHAIKVADREAYRYAMDHIRLISRIGAGDGVRYSLAAATDGKRAIVLKGPAGESDADGSRFIGRDTVRALKSGRTAPAVSINGSAVQGASSVSIPDQGELGNFPPIGDIMRRNSAHDIFVGVNLRLLRDTLDTLIKAVGGRENVPGTISFPAPEKNSGGRVSNALRIDTRDGELEGTALLMPFGTEEPHHYDAAGDSYPND